MKKGCHYTVSNRRWSKESAVAWHLLMLSKIQSAVPFNDLAVDAESLVRGWLKPALDRGYDIALHLSLSELAQMPRISLVSEPSKVGVPLTFFFSDSPVAKEVAAVLYITAFLK